MTSHTIPYRHGLNDKVTVTKLFDIIGDTDARTSCRLLLRSDLAFGHVSVDVEKRASAVLRASGLDVVHGILL